MTVLILLLQIKRITLKSQKIFRFILVSDLIICILKIVFRLTADPVSGSVSFSGRVADKCSALLMISLMLLTYYYYIVDFFKNFRSVRAAFGLVSAAAFAAAVSVAVIPIEYDVLPDGRVYPYGTAVDICGITMFVIILVEFIAMINHRRFSDRRKLSAYSLWLFFWVISFLFHYRMHIIVHEFFVALGILVLFIKAENPESYIDIDSGVFNENLLPAYISQYYEKHRHFSIVVIIPGKIGYNTGKVSGNGYSEATYASLVMNEITKYVNRDKNSIVFRNSAGVMTMLYREPEHMTDAASDLSKRLSEEWFFDTFSATISAVVCEIPECPDNIPENKLLDMIRYFVRECSISTGQKRYVLDDKWLSKMEKESNMASVVKEAIDHDKIEVFYQPIYSTSNKRFVSAEALVRIRDSEGNLIMPDEFIPVAEKSGFITELGKIVFRKACTFMKENDLHEKGIRYLEINLSAVQCVREELADQYIEIMEDLEIDPSTINLEITESAALSSMDVLVGNMQKLIDYGVEFSLDDFGTGYSNLNYIMDLPVSIVKFDRKMTNSYFETQKGKLVMEAAIDMIKAVGTRIVSEGVETKEQFETLEDACIDYIQGYYFSKPVCENDFLDLLRENMMS